MNIVLLQPDECGPTAVSGQQLELTGRRALHLYTVIKVEPGSLIKIGIVDGPLGMARVLDCTRDTVRIELEELTPEAPPPLPLHVILALPRPRMLGRILQTAATMGVSRLSLIHSARVEKSFWQTPVLDPAQIHTNLSLGLEQARATALPRIEQYRTWRAALRCAAELPYGARWVAHPGPYPEAGPAGIGPGALAIGPEGGFTEPEVEQLVELGFEPISLGPRILRVETAFIALIAKLY